MARMRTLYWLIWLLRWLVNWIRMLIAAMQIRWEECSWLFISFPSFMSLIQCLKRYNKLPKIPWGWAKVQNKAIHLLIVEDKVGPRSQVTLGEVICRRWCTDVQICIGCWCRWKRGLKSVVLGGLMKIQRIDKLQELNFNWALKPV